MIAEAPKIVPRWYQSESIDLGAEFLMDGGSQDLGGLIIIPTGAGKSVTIGGIAARLDGPSLIFQPSREILVQNFAKLQSYGFRPAVYSAALGRKQISGVVTLATIGSVAKKPHLFDHIRYILIDECHLVGSSGMYRSFFDGLSNRRVKILGLSATPYRLVSSAQGPMLNFLTRMSPRIFSKVVYYVQNGRLFKEGHLARLQYHEITGFDRSKLERNSTGGDYTDESVQALLKETNFAEKLERLVSRLLAMGRRGILVFTRFVEESRHLVARIPGAELVSAETSDHERARILEEFKAGKIRVVANSGVLTTGFDYPALDTVVMARPTLSLSLWYQIVGRAIRPHPTKPFAMVVDMVGMVDQFGKVEDLQIQHNPQGQFYVASRGRQLTNVPLGNGRY